MRKPIIFTGVPNSGKSVLGMELKSHEWEVVTLDDDNSQSHFVQDMLHFNAYTKIGFYTQLKYHFDRYKLAFDCALPNGSTNLLFVEGGYPDYVAMLGFKGYEVPDYLSNAVEWLNDELLVTRVVFLKMPDEEYQERVREVERIRIFGEPNVKEAVRTAVRTAVRFEHVLRDTYKSLGFSLVEIEPGTPEERVRIIRESISDQFAL